MQIGTKLLCGVPDETQRSGFGGGTTPAGVFRGQPPDRAALRPRWTSSAMSEHLPTGGCEGYGACEDEVEELCK